MAIPNDLYVEATRNHKKQVFCPLGHSFVYGGDTEEKRLRDELQREKDRVAAERSRADGAEASLRATKGHVTRLRKRVLDGECPMCGQHLRDVARHVKRVHSGDVAETEELA
jgi:DNA repair exonuclease SbcCD ATPase subunit